MPLPLLLLLLPPPRLSLQNWRTYMGVGIGAAVAGVVFRRMIHWVPQASERCCCRCCSCACPARHSTALVFSWQGWVKCRLLFLHTGKQRPFPFFLLCVQWWEERKLSILSNWLLFVCW
jgi:hypothetical protein